MDATLAILIFLFVIGLVIGSFLNVCIYRVPLRMSVTKPLRSMCPHCERQLTWYENIPVAAWMVLGAKCRTCKNPISGQYPLVEILSGFAMVASFIFTENIPTAVLIYILTATLIVITFIDLEHKIIPNRISYPGIIIGLCIGAVQQFYPIFTYPITTGMLDSVYGFLLGGGFFYVIGEVYYYATKRDGLGGGDIKLMAMTGALLGWRSIPPTIFVGSLAGAVIGILLMVFRGADRQLEIPFGPWLSLGVLTYIFGDLPFFRFY
ncbi:MAG: prepilin peptidase [Bdellovibrionales bacterium]|nr:prepilin peptidase [Bdellovibrionales bacterium]